ncbi:MAG: efflux RND transporter periplasmic adaptor subunit [Chloroflexaceae bacterium]|jgi:multidrug resistance efflux pump|nr:efflux RND transporter periplasmic adaptor subunit [Chloroflexaceae bacterium]
MHKRARIILPVLLILALASGGAWWWQQQTATAAASSLSGSGTIEAEEVLITAEIAGRVKRLTVDEGQSVSNGAVVAELDTALLEAQLAQARAAVALAAANLEQLQAGTRPEEIAMAEAQVAQAQALRDGAEKAYAHTVAILQNPQDVQVQVAQAQAVRDQARAALARLQAGSRPEDLAAAQSAQAQAQLNVQGSRDRLSLAKTQAEAAMRQAADALVQAQARYAQAKYNWEYVRDNNKDPLLGGRGPSVTDGVREQYYAQFVQAEAAMHQAEQALQAATAAYDTARQAEVTGVQTAEEQVRAAGTVVEKLQAGATSEELAQAQTALASAQRTLDAVLALRANPQQLQLASDNAQTQLGSAEAQLRQAQARLEEARNGPRSSQIKAAEAQLAQARAAQNQIEVQLGKAKLAAPRDGVILNRPIHEGEQVLPGAPVMTIGTLDTVWLTVYIGQTDMGRVRLGQAADVTVDGFPGKTFRGTVSLIGQQAEFTPRNVQTREERATTVFAVRIDLTNPDHGLKPGMAADAVLLEQ